MLMSRVPTDTHVQNYSGNFFSRPTSSHTEKTLHPHVRSGQISLHRIARVITILCSKRLEVLLRTQSMPPSAEKYISPSCVPNYRTAEAFLKAEMHVTRILACDQPWQETTVRRQVPRRSEAVLK